jgi:glyoxylate/hydroxypyruvate reductase A
MLAALSHAAAADSPLWGHPRVRLTPHIAGHSSGAAGAAQVVENWRRVRLGKPLLHVVDSGVQPR